MIKDAIGWAVTGGDLGEEKMIAVMNEIMGGEATPAQIGSFITALRMKGETIAEIVGAVKVMRAKATKIETGVDTASGEVLVDTCGTGGDGSGTFNVSTATAFVVAGAKVPVAKHGNHAISSSCGSADVLEALGVDLSLSAEAVGECVRSIGIGFLFAPMLHGAMKYAIGPRREIGIRTIFNILGPMTNPAGANVQVLGVFDQKLTAVLAEVMGHLGSKRALVVWGEGNLDELTVTGTTFISELDKGKVTNYTIAPEEVGLKQAGLGDIRGGKSAEESAQLMRDVLSGKEGARLDMVLLNSGAALMAAGKAEDLLGGVNLAREVVASGASLEKLDNLISFCNEHTS